MWGGCRLWSQPPRRSFQGVGCGFRRSLHGIRSCHATGSRARHRPTLPWQPDRGAPVLALAKPQSCSWCRGLPVRGDAAASSPCRQREQGTLAQRGPPAGLLSLAPAQCCPKGTPKVAAAGLHHPTRPCLRPRAGCPRSLPVAPSLCALVPVPVPRRGWGLCPTVPAPPWCHSAGTPCWVSGLFLSIVPGIARGGDSAGVSMGLCPTALLPAPRCATGTVLGSLTGILHPCSAHASFSSVPMPGLRHPHPAPLWRCEDPSGPSVRAGCRIPGAERGSSSPQHIEWGRSCGPGGLQGPPPGAGAWGR